MNQFPDHSNSEQNPELRPGGKWPAPHAAWCTPPDATGSPNLSVFLECYSKIQQTRWFQQHKFISLFFSPKMDRLRIFQTFKFRNCLTISSSIHLSLLTFYSKQVGRTKPLFGHLAQKSPQLNMQFHCFQVLRSIKCQNTNTIWPSSLPLYNKDKLSFSFQ